jgi:hypothetical protein
MSQAESEHRLVAPLWELYDAVAALREQTVHRMAEQAVLSWTQVLDGKGQMQPRLTASGYVPSAFHFGMESNERNRLDASARAGDLPRYREALGRYQDGLRASLERFFQPSGYRNSTDQCDQQMVELSRFSRFLGAYCLEVERGFNREHPGQDPAAGFDLYTEQGRGSLLFEVRFQLFYWEPYLNDAIVAWQQNSLPDYLATLRRLNEALRVPEALRSSIPHELGYPCRPMSRLRQKTIVVHPDGRPLRGKSMFELRMGQLLRRIETLPAPPLRTLIELEREVRHFMTMIRTGRFTVATEPSFQDVGRQTLSLVRSRPRVHPFLLDPVEFFKKALLFFNGTYTIAGGGLDPMYMQMRQLERYYRFEHWASARSIRAPLEGCLIGWEENRWDAFTAGMLDVAEQLKSGAAA